MPKVSSKPSSTTCDVCFASLARRADLARHMRLHDNEKSRMMYRCPFDGCEFANLQKCNVDTHIRVHRGVKDRHCPECTFSTGDPGSLTRHRKRMHGYEPKARRPRLGGAAKRTSPYPSVSPRSPAASESGPSETSGSSSGSSDSSSSSSSSSSSAPSPLYTISDSDAPSPSDSTTPATPVNMTLIDDFSALELSALVPYQTYPSGCSPVESCSTMGGQAFGCSSVTAIDNLLLNYPWQKGAYSSATSDMGLGLSLFSQQQEQLAAETDLASLGLSYPQIDGSIALTDMPFTLTGFEAAPGSYPVVPTPETMTMEPFADWPFSASYSPVSLPKVEAPVAELSWDSLLNLPATGFKDADSSKSAAMSVFDAQDACPAGTNSVTIDWDELFSVDVAATSSQSVSISDATPSDGEFDSLCSTLVDPPNYGLPWSF
ncbi:hypothetical protein PLEOSDRAFT_162898 [Pleurotus ostreatus PC15]|uniref:C2H2-type domain-containing protein n=1 Tax=Pleurotus ostreatus (strain PC15) TaxID=1137138 RepID=A0A067NH22_PLEO1|nr:hypothetical protein PLEOSDRAFT_162898 [Pleurotus ostreatus PC15]